VRHPHIENMGELMSYHASHYNAPPAPQRRRRVWPWFVGAVVLVLACAFGGVMLLGAGAESIDREIQTVEADRLADVKVTSCKVDPGGETLSANFTVSNSGPDARVYMIQINILGSDKTTIIGDATGITSEVPAGGTYKGKAVGVLSERTRKISCQLVAA